MRLMHGYKVVSWKGKQIRSWSYHLRGALPYYKKQWTSRYSNRGPLACFEHYNDAFSFIKENDHLHNDPKPFILPILFVPSQDIELWTSRIEFMAMNEIPHGTVFADAIYIL